MASVTMMKSKRSLDGSLNKRVLDMLQKITEDDTLPGLHIEPVQSAADPRVRTARVDDNHRAILFQMNLENEHHYIYIGVWPHDDAYVEAQRRRLQINPINGVLELLIQEATAPTEPQTPAPKTRPSAAAAPAYVNELVERGYTADELYRELGLDPQLVTAALSAASDDDLDAAVSSAPAWQQDAILGLAAGFTIDDVRESLSLNTSASGADSSDDALERALTLPATKMQFTYVGKDGDAMRSLIEHGSFSDWQTFLHPSQSTLVAKDYSGSARISGGAGTGKTVVLLHRTRELMRRSPEARIVLTTFTRDLATSLEEGLRALDPSLPIAQSPGQRGVCVAGIDALGNRILSTATAGESDAAATAVFGAASVSTRGRTNGADQWREALTVLSADEGLSLPAHLANPTFLMEEYDAVILAQGITTRDAYFKASRAGRGTPLTRAARAQVWRLVEAYWTICRTAGVVTFAEVDALAAAVLAQRAERGEFIADHVLVDEGQDFNAGHWLLVRRLVDSGPNDLFIAEDSHQRIYGQYIPLKRFGINIVGRSARLTLNYRTTAETLAYAVQILSGAEFTDMGEEAESTAGYRSLRHGPVPEVHACRSAAEEFDLAAEKVTQWTAEGANVRIGALFRSQSALNRFVEAMSERDVDATWAASPLSSAQCVATTMHKAKGMEFSHVLLTGLDEKSIPQSAAVGPLDGADRSNALKRERSLLYVAASRARDQLLVTYSATPTPLIAAGAPGENARPAPTDPDEWRTRHRGVS